MTENSEPSGGGRGRSLVVAGGILASRLMGLVRERAMAHYLGVGPHADVLRFALRAPNVLQNLLGEGTLSASFIPVYSRLLAAGKPDEARRFAGAIFGLLLAVVAGLSLIGILFAEPIVLFLAWGFRGDAVAGGVDRFPLAVAAVRWTLPMAGVLVLHAWALGVLNSHRRFFLPYFAPVLWNAAILAALWWVGGGGGGPTAVLMAVCWGALAGGVLQFVIQLPLVWRLMGGVPVRFSTRVTGVRAALGALGPVVAGRGVVQLASWLDTFLATLLAPGAVAALGFAQTLYVLPVSLFAMSVSASELPELARETAGAPGQGHPKRPDPDLLAPALVRVDRGLRQIAFLTVPTAVGYLLFGSQVVGLLFQTGAFGAEGVRLVQWLLGGYTLGLVATNFSRLLQNVYFAVGDTATQGRVAAQRVALAAALALPTIFLLDRLPVAPGSTLYLGALGLAGASAVGAWYELARLTRGLRQTLPAFTLPWRRVAQLAGVAGLAGVPALGLAVWLAPRAAGWPPALVALPVLLTYASSYLAWAGARRFPELAAWFGRRSRG